MGRCFFGQLLLVCILLLFHPQNKYFLVATVTLHRFPVIIIHSSLFLTNPLSVPIQTLSSHPPKYLAHIFTILFTRSISPPPLQLEAKTLKKPVSSLYSLLCYNIYQLTNRMSVSTLTSKLLLLLLLSLLLPQVSPRVALKTGENVKAASSEDTYRTMVYQQTQERIQEYNELYSEYYTAGHTIFSELTVQEFAALYLGGGMSQPGSVSRTFVQGPTPEEKSSLTKETYGASYKAVISKAGLLNDVVPSVFNVDYSQAPNILITNVKDQGGCGSCWAFAGIAEIESYFIKSHNLYLDLSEQQMVDCLPAVQSGNLGCGGGYLDSVGYYSTLYPIAQEKYYPYTATQASCNNDRIAQGRTFQIHSYVYIYDCITLANALLTLKPIGICGSIDAQWQTYVSGVVPSCGTSIGGHCVLLVGGVSDGTTNVQTNYWKIRNSWGVGWGEQGFMKLYRDYTDTQRGLCGFCTSAIYSI